MGVIPDFDSVSEKPGGKPEYKNTQRVKEGRWVESGVAWLTGLTYDELSDRGTVLLYYHGREGKRSRLGADESQDRDRCAREGIRVPPRLT